MKHTHLYHIQLMAWIDDAGTTHTKRIVTKHKIVKETYSHFHICGDVLKIAKAALGELGAAPRYDNPIADLQFEGWVKFEAEIEPSFTALRQMMLDAIEKALADAKLVLAAVERGMETVEEKEVNEDFSL